ncbi:MAG: NAD(P)H-dependent oxidoreductase [Verrucomicrobiota bacterium]
MSTAHTPAISPSQLIGALEWRYATKAFDSARKIPGELWMDLERALVLSPSSFGLQPYKFLIITDSFVREKLVPHSWGQKQVVDCSHYVVFAARTQVPVEYVDQYVNRIAAVRKVDAGSLKGYRDMMVGSIQGPLSQKLDHWTARQAYIALGNLLTAAALVGVDACPMEGFAPDKYNEILGLNNSGYQAVVACALGYRSATDNYARAPKVRLPQEILIERI